MTKKNDITVHPAIIAWQTIEPNPAPFFEIENLKKRNKSSVYRIKWNKPNKRSIIAKTGKFKTLKVEHFIYQKIFPECSFSSINCFGLVKENEDQNYWLFIEDANGEEYDSTNIHHRETAMRWLKEVHSSHLHENLISLLPDRSLNSYSEYLINAKANIIESFGNLKISEENKIILKDIISKLDKIESEWKQIQSACSLLPLSLVHGDFSPQNFKIRTRNGSCSLFAYDWELGGWGESAIDFGSLSFDITNDELRVYWSMLSDLPPDKSFSDIQRLTGIGRLLRLTSFIYWASCIIKMRRSERSFLKMKIYQKQMTDEFKKLGW